MADLPNDFWSGWIAIVTILSIVAMGWMVYSIYYPSDKYRKKEKADHEPVWDNNLREGNAAAPLWWFWLIFTSLIFSVVYLILYPGIGAFRGALDWSQDSRLEDSYSGYEQRFQGARNEIAGSDLAVLQNEPQLMETAARIFARNCAACHGEDGRGQASLFPNLLDVDWQWGASPQAIEQSIRNGRMAVMPPWQAALNDEGVELLADFIPQLATDTGTDHPGRVLYNQFCIACHGMEGVGNTMLGAPNLTDNIWLYGGDNAAIKTSLSRGRNGIMPAFGERLDDTQIKLLVAFLAR